MTARRATWGHRGARFALVTLLAAGACGTLLVIGGRPTPAVSAIPAMPVPAVTDETKRNGPEALLARTMREINANQLDGALAEVDKIIDAYPNFRLAHLIKGDILLARYQQERPTARVPRYLVQLNDDQRHAFVVDTSKSTL